MFNPDYSAGLKELNRQRLNRRLTQALIRVQAIAHEAFGLRSDLNRIQTEMTKVHLLNLELMMADAKRKGTYVLIWLALLACLLIDYIFLSAVAEYFASRVYSDPAMVTLAKILIPLAIVTIEMLISTYRAFNQQQNEEFFEQRSSKAWIVFTAGLLVFLPAMLIATHLVTLPETLTPIWMTVSLVQLVALLALSVVAHGAVLFGGALALEAKAYLYLKFCWWRLTSREQRLNKAVRQTTLRLTQSHATYLSLAREFVTENPTACLPPANFDTTTEEQLLEAYKGKLPTLEPATGVFQN